MLLDMKSILEADEVKPVPSDAINDETGANLDNTLSGADLMSIMDDICPISGDVFASMKNAAKDPENLRVTVVKNGEGEKADLFIEAYEFNNFCEANSITEGEGADLIIDTYKEEVPELDNAEFHVVFPEDTLKRNVLGGENLGRAIKNDWAMRLMSGCRRYGLTVNSGVLQEGGAREKYGQMLSDKIEKETAHADKLAKAGKYASGKSKEEYDKREDLHRDKAHNCVEKYNKYAFGSEKGKDKAKKYNYNGEKYSSEKNSRFDDLEYSKRSAKEFKRDFHDNSVDKLAEKQKDKEKETAEKK